MLLAMLRLYISIVSIMIECRFVSMGMDGSVTRVSHVF